MGFSLSFRVPTTNPTPTRVVGVGVGVGLPERFKKHGNAGVSGKRVVGVRVRGVVERNGGDGIDAGGGGERKSGVSTAGGGVYSPAMEVTTFNQTGFSDAEFPVWDQIGAVVRLTYGIG